MKMNHLSKNIIKNCINSLSQSTNSNLLENSSEWAYKMRNTIFNVIPHLESISDSIQEKAFVQPTDKEVEAWLKENISDDCSAPSAIYKFRLWLKDREISQLKQM